MTPTQYGERLREWLPAVWRERDENGHLGRLLDVYGELLDALAATVEQRLYDNFPDADANGRQCQNWLLPYFAQLLDVRLVSPDETGRRDELRDAVAWRQRKGTAVAIERIAEAVGGFEVEIQEGWKRVAVTPRLDRPLLPEDAYGEEAIALDATPAERARHPGLPAATVDLRYCSRAVQCDVNNSGAHTTTFAGEEVTWRQVNRHGTPCKPGSFQDVSQRTVDLRTPAQGRGLFHPRRVPLYLPPPEGHCSAQAETLYWSRFDAQSGSDNPLVTVTRTTTTWNGQTLLLYTYTGQRDVPVRMRGVKTFTEEAVYRFENLWLDNRVEISAGAAVLVNCAARQIKVTTAERDASVLTSHGCLIKKLEASSGRVDLEYVTVLDTLLAERLNASDCILMPQLLKDTVDADVPEAGCIRYSRLFHLPEPLIPTYPANPSEPYVNNDPAWVSQEQRSLLTVYADTCSTETPLFWSDTFGQPGCGVLHPDCDVFFQTGAEDGSEIGGCHDYRYVLRQKAVLEKLQEFLPMGLEAMLVMDTSLACLPPET